jgi:pilus assembly protein CpaB
MLTITLAAVLGLLGVVAVLAYVHQANERAVNGLKAETVVYATGEIRAGTSLKTAENEKLLGTEKLPKSSLSNSSSSEPVHSVTAANGHMILAAEVGQGSVVLNNMLTSASTVNSESGSTLVPSKDEVAVSVHMCMSEAVAGYITVGSYIALFDTLVAHPSGIVRTCETQHDILGAGDMRTPSLAATMLVLAKARVLAVTVNPAAPNASGGSNNSSVTANNDPPSSASSTDEEVVITLAVDQEDAERAILVDEVGLPYMALLSGSNSTATAPGPPVNLITP